jgi:hypothetical protein
MYMYFVRLHRFVACIFPLFRALLASFVMLRLSLFSFCKTMVSGPLVFLFFSWYYFQSVPHLLVHR